MIAGCRQRRGVVGLMLALLLCQTPLVGGAELLHCAAVTTSGVHAHHLAEDDHAAHHAAGQDTADDECGIQAGGSDHCGVSPGSCVLPAALIGADPCSSRLSSTSSVLPASAAHAPPYRPPSAS